MTPSSPLNADLPIPPEWLLHIGHGDCPVCLGKHDHEIHAATLSIRLWFRGEVTKGFWVYDPTDPRQQTS